MATERGTVPSWAYYLSPVLLLVAGLFWIWLYLSSDPLENGRQLSLIMALVCAGGAGYRLFSIIKKGRATDDAGRKPS